MISASQLSLLSVQIAVWLPNSAAFTQSRFLGSVLGNYSERYDGDPQIMPFGPEVPDDVPRIILQSKDERWKIQAGTTRIDSSRTRNIHDMLDDKDTGEKAFVYQECVDVLSEYLQDTGNHVTRVGIITSRFLQVENAAQILVDRFSSEEAKSSLFVDSQSFEIHNHRLYKLPLTDYDINGWVRCKSGILEPLKIPVLVVEQDINTPVEANLVHFNGTQLAEFVGTAFREMTSTLDLYFPEEI